MLLGGIIINFLDFKIDDSLKEQLSVLDSAGNEYSGKLYDDSKTSLSSQT